MTEDRPPRYGQRLGLESRLPGDRMMVSYIVLAILQEAKAMKDGTLCFVLDSGPPHRVLLGFKKGGFGAGKIDGFGGKVEPGETIAAAAARELQEESSIVADPEHLEYVALLDFCFPFRPEWSQMVHAFVTRHWTGTPTESDEMIPHWHSFQEIPYTRMWGDSAYWLPLVLSGKRLRARIVFLEDNETVGQARLELLSPAEAAALAAGQSGCPAAYPPERDQIWKLRAIGDGLARRFPDGNDIYQIMTRLLEECGEVAQQVNHFQGSGIKREKMGEPSAAHLAQEIKHVLLNALRVVQHYGVEQELSASIESSYQTLVKEGWIETAAPPAEGGKGD